MQRSPRRDGYDRRQGGGFTRPLTPNHVMGVTFTDELLVVHLGDGCVLSVPLSWYPELQNAASGARDNWLLTEQGCGVLWPEVGTSFSVTGLLHRTPSFENAAARARHSPSYSRAPQQRWR